MADVSNVIVTITGGQTGITDANGYWRISPILNGTYLVTVTKDGCVFVPTGYNVTVDGGSTEIGNFTLSPITVSGSISGVGKEGVTVTLGNFGSTTTDSNGDYSFSDVLDGIYDLTVSKDGYSYTPYIQDITVNRADVIVDTIISNYVTVTGSISGVGKEGVTVTLGNFGSTTTDSNGDYSFNAVLAGTYSLTVALAGYTYSPDTQDVTVNGVSVVIDPIVSAVGLYDVSGTVTGVGKAGATVTLSGYDSTTTDIDGNYSFINVPGRLVGYYLLTVSKDGYIYPGPYVVNVTTQDVIINPIGSGAVNVSGTITGVGKSGVLVTLGSFGNTTTDVDGNYSFSTVLDGIYSLTVSLDGYTYTPDTQDVTVNRASVVVDPIVSSAVTVTGVITNAAKSGVLITLGSFGNTTTDINGNYSFSVVPDGVYSLTISRDGRYYSPNTQSITVNRASIVATPSVGSYVTVSGGITGAGRVGVTVTLGSFGSTTTSGIGNYSFLPVLDGTYSLTVAKDGYIYTPDTQSVTVNRSNVSALVISSAVAP